MPERMCPPPAEITQEQWNVVRDLIFSEIKGRCRTCGTTQYTERELNISIDQHNICYRCLDEERSVWPGVSE